MKILFMGTPEFAQKQLRALWENSSTNGWELVGAVSQPDKPKGRGYKLIPTPVKEYAMSIGIPVYQPETLKDGAFEEQLKQLAPDLIVVAAYGPRMYWIIRNTDASMSTAHCSPHTGARRPFSAPS